VEIQATLTVGFLAINKFDLTLFNLDSNSRETSNAFENYFGINALCSKKRNCVELN
jgi:hypothetical protein